MALNPDGKCLFPVHIQANLEDELVKEALKTVRLSTMPVCPTLPPQPCLTLVLSLFWCPFTVASSRPLLVVSSRVWICDTIRSRWSWSFSRLSKSPSGTVSPSGGKRWAYLHGVWGGVMWVAPTGMASLSKVSVTLGRLYGKVLLVLRALCSV